MGTKMADFQSDVTPLPELYTEHSRSITHMTGGITVFNELICGC